MRSVSLTDPPVSGTTLAVSGDSAEKAPILIVDDLPEKLLVLRTILEDLNQHLVFVRSGREALREVLQREFAVILLDVNMPDLDGFEAATMIRRYKPSAHTPIIFITAFADDLQTARGYALGAVDYILSPVVPQVLRSKVQVFVNLFAMQRQLRRQADAHAAFVAAEAARRAAEENDRRSAFLSHASGVLNRSLRVAVGIHDLAGLIVPQIASLALVMGADDETPGAPILVATRIESGGNTALFVELSPADLGEPVRTALRTAMRHKQRCDFTAAQLARLDASSFGLKEDTRAVMRFRAAAVVPLLNGDHLLGALLVASRIGDTPDAAIDWRVLEDLAARAAAAFENVRLYESLQTEIAERRAAEAALQESNRRKDEFLAMLSHELRNPLAPIQTSLEVIRLIAPADPKIIWASDVMVRQLRQVTRLIEELLDVARINQGKIVLKPANVDLNAVLRQSVEAAKPFMDARDQLLRVTPFADSVGVYGDFARLAQIVSNLLNNASKYSEKGTLIELTASLDEQGAVICVRDQGIGMDAELLPRIFELFTQGRRGLDRSQGGLGVGLTLARRLAELHGGTIEATSEGAGRGSTFTLRLPCIGLVSSEGAAALPAPSPVTTVCRILVVDDNQDAAQSVTTFLELEGHVARSAADGIAALEAAAAFTPDVVVLDIGLPLLNGYEVARRLRQLPATRGALLLALTGYGQQEDRAFAESAGFDRHFTKPTDPATLLSCINAWALARKQKMEEPANT